MDGRQLSSPACVSCLPNAYYFARQFPVHIRRSCLCDIYIFIVHNIDFSRKMYPRKRTTFWEKCSFHLR